MARPRYPLSIPDADKFELTDQDEIGFAYVMRNIEQESDRGMVLILSGFLEEVLLQLLLSFFAADADRQTLADGAGSPLASLSSRIALSHALGLIDDDDRKELGLIRNIRNDFAHEPGASFAQPAIASRCSEFVHMPEAMDRPKDRFKFSCVGLIMALMRRRKIFEKERRTALDPALKLSWEAIPDEELPEEGASNGLSIGGWRD
jgi:hypothetical protein